MDIPVIFKFLPLQLRLIAIKIDRWLAINWMMAPKSLHRKWLEITRWWLTHPFEKYEPIWIISPSMGEHAKCLKPPPRNGWK